MDEQDFSDAALVIVGHGTELEPDSSIPVRQHACELRQRKVFALVREAFWKQEPKVIEVLARISAPRVFVVPFLMSAGYFCEQVVPQALGFPTAQGKPRSRVQRTGQQTTAYCHPVGTAPNVMKVVLGRAHDVLAKFPFPRAPEPDSVSLFIAGHGTARDENSRQAVLEHAERIRATGVYAEVQAVYMEEEPGISACCDLACTNHIVVVPFFISDGLHVKHDIPRLLGEAEPVVRRRLESGQSPWRNPTERNGKLIWYTPAVGTDSRMAEIILERVLEAAKW